MVDLIDRVLFKELNAVHGFNRILYTRDGHDFPAYVNFRPAYPRVLLHVAEDIWKGATKGESFPYFVLAHEVGHILLHDHRAVSFTSDHRSFLQFASHENSAEWQADTFAKHLTMPDHALRKATNSWLLSANCNVEQAVAQARLDSYMRTGPMLQFASMDEPCPHCQTRTLVHDGLLTTCDTCGVTSGYT